MNKKLGLITLFLVVTFGINIFIDSNNVSTDVATLDNSNLEVHFIDVGQGDSTFIESNNEVMLIDAGEEESSEKIIEFLKDNDVTTLKYVVATHPHSDHIGGVNKILDTFEVENIIMPNATTNTKTFEDLVTNIKNKNINVIMANKNSNIYSLGDSQFKLLSPKGIFIDNLNNNSVVLKLEYENASFLFTGDIEKEAENQLVYSNLDLSSTVLKVAHHGSDTSSTVEFLNKVNPIVSVISVGEGNSYNHPYENVIRRINEYSEYLYRTDINGTVSMYTDGEQLEIECEK